LGLRTTGEAVNVTSADVAPMRHTNQLLLAGNTQLQDWRQAVAVGAWR
jgi:hypothetical protein